MKIILLKDVKGQGKKHEIIEVKDGYGNNFLIKNGLGVLLTPDSVKRLKNDIKLEEENEAALIKKAKETKEKIEKETFVFYLKAGDSDRVFGTISQKQIYDFLTEKGYEIDKKKILIDEKIQSLGHHKIKVELYKSVIALIDIEIKKK